MIKNICLLLEVLSIIICLHCLYGKKLKLDIATVSLLSIDMIIMTVINYYGLPKTYTMVIYPVIFIYCGIKFGFKFRVLLISNILYMTIVSGIQLIVSLIYGFIFNKIEVFREIELLVVNCIVFVLILLLPKFHLNNLLAYLQDKERIYVISLVLCIAVTISFLVSYKWIESLEFYQSILLFVGMAFIGILITQLSRYKIKAKEIETELKMHQIYADSFHSLISDIRLRQHEFDNHINTIYSQHYMYNTLEELINAQKDYCQIIIRENRFNKLLTAGNPIVIGFLYGKFIEIERLGIDILYKISVDELNVGVPVYKMVEILGNLIKNAVEAMGNNKALFVGVVEVEGEFEIEVRNKSRFIEQNELENFFKKGYSKKGVDRGFGLYNVKNICSEYKLQIWCENKNVDNENWLSFTINNKKEAVKVKDAKISMPMENGLFRI